MDLESIRSVSRILAALKSIQPLHQKAQYLFIRPELLVLHGT